MCFTKKTKIDLLATLKPQVDAWSYFGEANMPVAWRYTSICVGTSRMSTVQHQMLWMRALRALHYGNLVWGINSLFTSRGLCNVYAVADTGLFGGGMRRQFAMNPMLHRTIMRKSITFAYVQLRGNKSKFGLRRSLSDKTGQTLTLHRYGTNKQCGT